MASGRLEFYCPRWGSEALGHDAFCRRVREAGYDGVELGFPRDVAPRELDAAWEAAARAGLKVIAQHWDTTEADFARHREHYAAWWARLEGYPLVKVNTQTGRDHFDFEQNAALIADAAGYAASLGTAVAHETHRGKFSFAAHVTRDYLERLPGLRLTLDISHWCAVAETYLADQQAAVELALARTDHLHARVGHPQGPQVPDPRVAAWREALDVHLAWWERLARRFAGEGRVLTVTPEFGPAPYMTYHPLTGEPLADQWSVNVYMMELLRERL